ncbi:MAG: M28 family peptidase [Flavobacteriaceae bacterium]|nr:M28 family peptidase [Bacteroidia bacterium]NNK81550.1 M28 family peptidase [Flavobacteriaceae bacterium]
MKQVSLLVFFLTLVACKQEYTPENKIKEDVIFLADDKLEGRGTGTEGEKIAADYIAKRFESLRLEGKGTDGFFQDFMFTPKKDPHSEVKYSDKNTDSTITGRNILAYLDNKAEQTIIIGAHYDHLGYGDRGGSLYRGEEKLIHNGADDNASGVALMLNLASKLKETNKNNNYLFMAFSGEEMGLLGSNYFVKNTTLPIESINYMLNMDMVGRLKADSTLAVYGTGTSPIFKQTVSANNEYFKIVEHESGVGPSDHTSFYLNDIPVLHFFTGQHDDYHRPTDDSDKLNYEGMNLISDYIFTIITDLDDNGEIAFRKTKNESKDTPRFKVTLGVVPDYLYTDGGMRIDGVSEDRPAQKAGLMKGDIVIQLGDLEVKDMMGYMKALSKFEKGQTTTVKVKRDGKVLEAQVTF